MRSVGLEVYGYAVGVVSLFLGGCSGQRPARTFSGIVFEYVAGGRSTVGVEGGDRESLSGLSRQSIEVPDLCVSRGEITQRQWSAVTGSNPSYFMRCGPDCPVEQVSWFEALRFANTLSARHELQQTYVFEGDTVGWKADADGFRLLTEVEWEHAAGGGENSPDTRARRTRKRWPGWESLGPPVVPTQSARSKGTALACATCRATYGNGPSMLGVSTHPWRQAPL